VIAGKLECYPWQATWKGDWKIMSDKRNKLLSVAINQHEKDMIEALAKYEHRTKSEVVREIIRKAFEKMIELGLKDD
jgi:predicted DNA-binding protein